MKFLINSKETSVFYTIKFDFATFQTFDFRLYRLSTFDFTDFRLSRLSTLQTLLLS